MVRHISKKLLILACLSVVFLVGCASDDPLGPDGEPLPGFEELPGDVALGSRVGLGTRVSAAEAQFPAVGFDYDSFLIRNDAISTIERVAQYMKRNRDVKLVVEGHCDENGSREYNLSLGEHRALAVRAYLVRLGIRSDRIQTRSYGEENPVDPGHDEGAWRQNRRGEFVFYR